MLLCRIFDILEGKWYTQHAEASVLQEFPRECIFLKKKFSRAEDCAESELTRSPCELRNGDLVVRFIKYSSNRSLVS